MGAPVRPNMFEHWLIRPCKLKLGRARVAFRMMDKVWTSNEYSRRTKLRLFNSNAKQLLLCGSETLRSAKTLTNKIQVFINISLRGILGIRRYDKINNVELWKATDQESTEVQHSSFRAPPCNTEIGYWCLCFGP